jgi:hypothetical protein
MTEVVETASYVTFQNPLRRCTPCQSNKALFGNVFWQRMASTVTTAPSRANAGSDLVRLLLARPLSQRQAHLGRVGRHQVQRTGVVRY